MKKFKAPDSWQGLTEEIAGNIIKFAKDSPELSIAERCRGILTLMKEGYYGCEIDIEYFKMIKESTFKKVTDENK